MTPEGERVLACLDGAAKVILAEVPQLLACKDKVNCGGVHSASSSGYIQYSNILANNRNSDPIVGLLTGLFG